MIFNRTYRTSAVRAPILLFLAFLASLVLAGSAIAKPLVEDARIGIHPDKTRFVLELSERPQYRIFTIDDPYRLVIDLPELDWPDRKETTPQAAGLVSALRYGLFTPGTSRVVLDLSRPAEVAEILTLPPRDGRQHRLVVDMAEIEPAVFRKRAQRKVHRSDDALRQASLAMPSPPQKPARNRRPTIVVDAGHGGVDPGAIGVSGTREKDLVLTYARALRDKLKGSGRYNVVMTRDDDRFIPLRGRVDIAEKHNGDLFISLHANTNPSSRVKGASVYTLSENASDAEAAALAAKENRSDVIAGVDLSNENPDVSQILISLARRDAMNSSKSFANVTVKELGKRVDLLRNTHRFAGFAVLKSTSVPSVLFEIGYMSHPAEEQQLQSAAHRKRLIDGLFQAIDRHFDVQQAYNRN
ncbi:N-acetylmuramoyl-L-alanine amidase [Fodinicurvata sediminis]|uniref:N-acetylmuramoyl-L-alanine amidase n=1 Tax=Fodinicurvata sediminis TaxID=1121832 RepID=UPI0003B3037C|nr:N-acetylmuramoyl-L-alanine amidase [Fodinicurvata sediminis]